MGSWNCGGTSDVGSTAVLELPRVATRVPVPGSGGDATVTWLAEGGEAVPPLSLPDPVAGGVGGRLVAVGGIVLAKGGADESSGCCGFSGATAEG